ncbi:L,D-transpeptidase family protein [Ponticaulis sp.]|uniref:L,D-transpeptidase family protein n=1 Tax=Ponticaulis sp. TaxID=2020902 RepID=UPI000B701F41|nr:L,D-transpeptidase family protein [Ponticaulis sp.]MAI90861.1 hypothetical protein [Ponticaulis sp.]OUX98835.1 MAG: hypothetical protein CBB65_10490 [Hyphomonadaceae bacterium TMED5]|tara:strand:- start:24510 stop:26414 length:1905 start_codon:yes stop_codon:yes gene_type:complete
MSRFTGYTKHAKMGVCAAALFALATPLANAENLIAAPAAPQDAAVIDASLNVPVPSGVASAIQTTFERDTIDPLLDVSEDSGANMIARIAYAQRVFEPVWTEQGVASLVEAASELSEHGIHMGADYADHIQTLSEQRFSAASSEARAEADIELTAAWLEMAELVSGGLVDEGEAVRSVSDAPARSELVVMLAEAGNGNAVETLELLAPRHVQYRMLQQELRRYNDITQQGGWQAIPELDDVVEPGDDALIIPALRERLIAEGYYSAGDFMERAVADFIVPDNSASVETVSAETDETADATTEPPEFDFDGWYTNYDEALVEAVEAFQRNHGLEVDGVLGPNTLEALNESVESKVERIETAMDFWRGQDMGERYVWANIPSYTVEGWADGQREISMKSIVGLPSRQTPVFSDEIEYAVANPRWYAPTSIVARDKLPRLQDDPSYAERNGYTIYDRESGNAVSAYNVDWTDPASASSYQFVQAPGAGNALGELKIIFPNQHAVYLHGTPSTYLFDRAERAFSSGCVRLEDPVRMAEWVAGGVNAPEAQELQDALATGDLERVNYETRTPVHLTYVTVTVDDEGRANFWRDIYNREGAYEAEDSVADLYDPDALNEAPDNIMASATHMTGASLNLMN